MNSVFADTFYFLALLNVKDAAHARACEYSESQDVLLVTTAWVLTEVANSLARSSKRQVFRRLLEDLEASPENHVVAASQDLFGSSGGNARERILRGSLPSLTLDARAKK
jgi:uncharacterized protein